MDKNSHFINSTYLQHTKHETRTILKYKTKKVTLPAVTIGPDFAGHLQVYQPVVFGLTHSFYIQSLTQEVLKRQKWCLMVICSRNSSNQSLKILKPAFFCFKDLYCLFCSPYPFSCHSYAQALLLYVRILCILPRWENQKCRCYPRWLLYKYTIFSLSCSNENFPVCIRTKTTGSQFRISGLLQLGTNFRNSHNRNSEQRS